MFFVEGGAGLIGAAIALLFLRSALGVLLEVARVWRSPPARATVLATSADGFAATLEPVATSSSSKKAIAL